MPYIPHTEADRQEMLAEIGVSSIDELFREIPQNLRLKPGELNLPPALDESQLMAHLREISKLNIDMSRVDCFLGAGIYDRYIPASVGAVISRGEFLTAYTPYQPELSQGYLQAIFEFQSMIAELYGMDVANASMYDASTGFDARNHLVLPGKKINIMKLKAAEVVFLDGLLQQHFRTSPSKRLDDMQYLDLLHRSC